MKLLVTTATRAEHFVPGDTYVISGHTTSWRTKDYVNKFPIPPQFFRCKEKASFKSLVDPGSVRGILLYNIGTGWSIKPNHAIGLWDVNVPEHGEHDRHIYRITEDQMRKIMGETKSMWYRDISKHRVI